jgi:hypothetical protein
MDQAPAPGLPIPDTLVVRVSRRSQRIVQVRLNGAPIRGAVKVLRFPKGDGTEVVQLMLMRATVEDEHEPAPQPWPWLQAFMAKLRGGT